LSPSREALHLNSIQVRNKTEADWRVCGVRLGSLDPSRSLIKNPRGKIAGLSTLLERMSFNELQDADIPAGQA
jgi:hypothetical protein